MSNHNARDHATWSASATARLWACPGSLRLAGTVERPGSNPAADWGTCCHQLAEKCLRENKDAIDYLGTTEHAKARSYEVDEEMATTAQEYVDYVRRASINGTLQIEQKFSLESLKPPFDAGGTADAVIYTSDLKMLEVVDLKGGRGVVVEVKGNPQLRTYALGAVLANQGLDVERVQVTIVQPRAPHKDGRIRSEIFHVADLVEWTADLLAAMRRAADPDAPLAAGDHCKFCPAAAICPALSAKSMEAARMWFDDQDTLQRPNTPDTLMPEDLVKILDNADMIQDWINAVRAYAHAQAEMGVVIPGYQLVDKRATRKWNVDENKVREELFIRADLTDSDVFTQKIKSVAQIEKTIGKKKAEKILQGLWAQESSGTNLVRSDKTTRPAVQSSVNKHFEVLE